MSDNLTSLRDTPTCDARIGGGYFRGVEQPVKRCRKKARFVTQNGAYKFCPDHATGQDRAL